MQPVAAEDRRPVATGIVRGRPWWKMDGQPSRRRDRMRPVATVCCAEVDGCPAEYNTKRTEADVLRYAEGKAEGLLFSMSILGQCKHTWKSVYSRVRGSSPQKQVTDLVDKPCNLLSPSRRAKKELMAVKKGDFAIGNHGGRATNRFTQYEMNRKPKDEYRKMLNLTDDTLTNTINMSNTLKEIDKKAREDQGDNSKDYLGLVQDSGIHNWFYTLLFTKPCLQVSISTFLLKPLSTRPLT